MIQITPQMRILVAIEPCDFRKGIDGLACQKAVRQAPTAEPSPRPLRRCRRSHAGRQPEQQRGPKAIGAALTWLSRTTKNTVDAGIGAAILGPFEIHGLLGVALHVLGGDDPGLLGRRVGRAEVAQLGVRVGHQLALGHPKHARPVRVRPGDEQSRPVADHLVVAGAATRVHVSLVIISYSLAVNSTIAAGAT